MLNLKPFIPFILFGLLGCGRPPEFNSDKPLTHHRIDPKQKHYSYQVDNVFSMQTQALSSANSTLPKLPDQNWSSSLALNLNLTWLGYHQHPEVPEAPLAVFNMDIKDMVFGESDQLPEWLWSWEEKIGKEPNVIFKTNGLTQSNPLGKMLGDPRQYFLKGENQLSFTSSGQSARDQKGDLISKLQILDHPAFIGQYFLNGLPLDEILHRSMVALPPLNFKDRVTWTIPHQSHLKGDAGEQSQEKWQAELTERDHLKLWKVKMTLNQSIPKGESVQGQARFQYWTLNREVEAWVYPDQGMCLEITIVESGSWVDVLSYQDKTDHMQHMPQQHRFMNRFHLSRS